MMIPVEIMLRGNDRVYTETLVQPGDPSRWTADDVATLLKGVLTTIDRIQNPGKPDTPEVALRGISWIVHPVDSGVVIALEIHSASVVAGPVDISSTLLESLITKALKGETPGTVVH